MSLVIHYENGKLIRAEQTYIRTTPSPVYAAQDGKTFIMGHIFDATHEDVAQSNWKQDPNTLNSFEGAISAAYADDTGCTFASDIHGIEIWYAFHKDNRFILSDNFWDIVKIVQPSYEDLDIARIRSSLAIFSVVGDTPIQNLKQTFPFSIGKYNPKTNQLSIDRYMDFKYTGEITDVDEAVERMDQILNQSMQKIMAQCGDVVYGIGISGGLDSRVVLHYATKNGMKLKGFNVCVPRPHKLLLAKSCMNANQIAKAFNAPFQIVKWNANTVEDKIKTKVKNYPLGGGRNSFKYEPNVPVFDALLAGSTGEIVGGDLPNQINDYSRDELIASILTFFTAGNNNRAFKSRAARGLNYLFGTNFDGTSASAIHKLLTPEELQKTQSTITDLVDEGIRAGQTNLEIFENFLLNTIGFQNRYGAFESMFGTKPSFSIYIPFLLKETLKWSPELLYGRKALTALIVKKIPEVKDVQTERYEPAPGQKLSKLNKLLNMTDFILRGNGVAIGDYWTKKVPVKKKLAARLDNGCQWFTKIFKIDAKSLRSLVVGSGETELMINVWELKTLIDCLETKEYLHY